MTLKTGLSIGLTVLLLGGLSAVAFEEHSTGCHDCLTTVVAAGDFEHYRVADTFPIATTNRPERFREELFGSQFTLSVPQLDAGTYTIEFQFAELFFKDAGRRVFDITRGEETLAADADIVKAAGGPGKVYTLTCAVQHAGDALRGPLTFTFKAKQDKAKFSALRILNAKGKVMVDTCARDFVSAASGEASKIPIVSGPELYKDPGQPFEVREADLIRRMSPAEKVSQLRNDAAAVPRLGIPAYNYWNECLHGIGRAGIATVFPQAIGLAAMWDAPFHQDVADAISTEARAKYNSALQSGRVRQYYGLTFWTPNINLFRDPRWGRGHETYGEDPFLTGRLGVAFIKGLQGDNPKYLKTVACAKHYAVHSGPEPSRHTFNATPSDRDLYECYLPQFEAAVREGGVMSVMGAYNRVYGEPACSSTFLLTDLLRKTWGFKGHVVSDCGAIRDIYAHHRVVSSPEEAAARAVLAGCDLACDGTYSALVKALQKGLITEPQIDTALTRVIDARFRLGMFDPPEQVPFSSVPIATNDCPRHQALALRAAEETMVLLKNSGLLPIDLRKTKHIAVIGPNADDTGMMFGNYNGSASHPVNILQGIRDAAAMAKAEVVYERGVGHALRHGQKGSPADPAFTNAVAVARKADVVIFVGGIGPHLEGEEGEGGGGWEGFAGGDRTCIELPSCQSALLKALQATGRPVVFVNCSGSAIGMPWEAEHLPAILQAWYPGQAGGIAVANVLFGKTNPGGRLPITFYRSTADLPAFTDYSMTNRTYRYFTGKPLFAFGHGLSYTTFKYGLPALSRKAANSAATVLLSIPVTNIGKRDGDEVVQVYYRPVKAPQSRIKQALCGFRRVTLAKGTTQKIVIPVPLHEFRRWDMDKKRYVIDPGDYELRIGAASDDIRAVTTVTVL